MVLLNLKRDTKPIMNKIEEDGKRPWGAYFILADEGDHKVKRIEVEQGKRLSLQRHKRRAEHWYVVQGEGIVTIDSKTIPCTPGVSVDIPKQALTVLKIQARPCLSSLKFKQEITLEKMT